MRDTKFVASFRSRGFSTLGLLWLLGCCSAGGFLIYKGVSENKKADATRVATVHQPKYKNIEDVKVGDFVLAKDPEDLGPPKPHKVLACIESESFHIVHVGVDSSPGNATAGEIQATQYHPFWVRRHGWTFAKDLHVGDELQDVSGDSAIVQDVRIEDRHVKTYNLSVEGVLTFYVATGNCSATENATVLVHNAPFGNVDGGGPVPCNEALDAGAKWVGPGYREIAPGIFRSADNARQFRMTTSDLTDPKIGPHVHYESVGPDGRTLTENSHVKICP